MARRQTEEQQLQQMLAKLEPQMRAAFFASIRDLNNRAVVIDIERMLEAGDIDAIIKSIGINSVAFSPLAAAAEAAFAIGGTAAINRLPAIRGAYGERLQFRFDVRNPAAERRLLYHSSTMITRITSDTQDAVRRFLISGLEGGVNPKQLAGQLVGAYDRVSGHRVGGVIGLSKPQERWLSAALEELQGGSKQQLNNYLTRAARDRRFDSHVIKAIDTGQAIPGNTVSRMITRYSDKLLKVRADTIALTETMEALNAAKLAANAQIADQLGLDPDEDAVKVWKAANDERTRPDHMAMNSVEVIGLDTPFTLPDGSQMLHPCDTALGAPASQTIRCRCTYFVRLNYLKAV